MRINILFHIITILFFSSNNFLTLEVDISDLKNSKGQVLLELRDSNKNVVKEVSQTIENNQCIIILDKLKPGQYTFKYFHDENNNEKLDTNFIGMPIEGFGFSNNAKGNFGPPSHEKTIFELTENTSVNCTPLYLKK